tara:strand:- start:15610 stop:16272 length:663 start_codon:yes stop_codon:yes gene_type:complete
MKKLIVPIILGVVMFGIAFGGAYYFHNYQQGATERQIRSVASATLADLQKQAKLTAYVARFAAVVSAKSDAPEQADAIPARLFVIPGTVSYDLNLRAIGAKDIVWHEAENMLSVKVPPPKVSGPELAEDDLRVYGADGSLLATGAVGGVLSEHVRITAKVSVLEQAKGEKAMRSAREAIRTVIARAFTDALRAEGLKAAVKVSFADEKPKAEEDDEGHDD